MKQMLPLNACVGKTIESVETDDNLLLIEFMDGSCMEIFGDIRKSPSRHWNDEAELVVRYEDGCS